jgi:hypothetical protein
MTYLNSYSVNPPSIRLRSCDKTTKLIVKGQGVFIFDSCTNLGCEIYIYDTTVTDGFKVVFTPSQVYSERISTKDMFIDGKNSSGLVSNSGANYWISVDAQNQTLRVGVGEARVETIIYNYTFLFQNDADRKANKEFFESLETIHVSDLSTCVAPLRLLRDPVTARLPSAVLGTDELSMDAVASGAYLPKSNLSLEAQQLYDCISGKKFVLDDASFPEFSEAIEYSIKTPGLWCNTRLKEKSTEFNKEKPNILETYLRITIGQNNGESPGIPYVMEIWPVGHYSPVHSHSGANAIIRVLNGAINVSQFPYLSFGSEGDVKPFAVNNFKKDMITWISPTLNQTHQLLNLDTNKKTCITIQCYMYDNKDKAHYDYFDYIDANGQKKQYEPDSDMDFVVFKKLMKDEWSARQGRGCFGRLRKWLGLS